MVVRYCSILTIHGTIWWTTDMVTGLEVGTNTKTGGVPSPREDHPDLGAGGNTVASKVTEILPL
eukprot:7799459-Pyramimonas_sp.AAC.1